MATVILSHKVLDYAKWRPIYDSDIQRRKDAGFTNEKVYREADDPNHIYIIADVTDPKILAGMMADPKLAEKMAEGGVVGEPSLTILYPA